MSYQVLARKWRPQTFQELVGQAHVLKALVNALDRDQLHHAYLFTGTRGVGKTTIARILARCLNCETGVSSVPCGTCSACREITEGRFVDLLEVDAASRTKVEDTRELLENVQYAPVRGRYKVYLIDEVHMLSTHSFNALLKTLEEPPPHVKFLLATTDPQKLPATVLSRCLQFHLKNMSPERIVEHLQHVLGSELIKYDTAALWSLAHAAEGSMRDALSLTDQAIAFGAGEIREADVNAMLGSIDRNAVWRLLAALECHSAEALMQQVDELAQLSADFVAVLDELMHCLHLIMRQQLVPNYSADIEQQAELQRLAAVFSVEQVQLYYQIAVNGRRDIAYAPLARQGLEVVLLRMLAFKPLQVDAVEQPEAAPVKKSPSAASPLPQAAALLTEPDKTTGGQKPVLAAKPTKREAPIKPVELLEDSPPPERISAKPEERVETTENAETASLEKFVIDTSLAIAEQWLAVFDRVPLSGVLKSVASNCELTAVDTGRWLFVIDAEHSAMLSAGHAEQLAQALSQILPEPVKASITVGKSNAQTPAAAARRLAESRHAEAMLALQQDPAVQNLIENYGAVILPDSVSLLDDKVNNGH